ncbi:MAG: MFS transporter, partial [Geminicoccales bacterium]
MDRPASRLGQVSWALYDWANSAFSAVIITFVFATYFSEAVAADSVSGTAQWGWAMSASGIAIAVISPVLGAIADAGGRRKPWLLAFTGLAVLGCFLLWYARPTPEVALMVLVVAALANLAFEIAGVFYNAMLPE